jgi:hypothetical protein
MMKQLYRNNWINFVEQNMIFFCANLPKKRMHVKMQAPEVEKKRQNHVCRLLV